MTREQIEKEFDEKFHCGQDKCNCADGIGSILNVKSFLFAKIAEVLEEEADYCMSQKDKTIDAGLIGQGVMWASEGLHLRSLADPYKQPHHG